MDIIKKSPTLFKKTQDEVINQWNAEVLKKDDLGYVRTTYGQVGGKLHTTEWTLCEPTNVGKKNERNSIEQAVSVFDSLVTEKLSQGRYTTDPAGEITLPSQVPMLAKDYHKFSDRIWNDGSLVVTQPKLDGIRCLANHKGLWTRQGKPILSCPHIFEEVKLVLKDLDPAFTLDGELYNHDLRDNFQKITSLVRKGNPTADSLTETRNLVEYHVYDVVNSMDFYKRFANFVIYANGLGLKYIKLVPCKIPSNEEELDMFHSVYLNNGYEGTMVRWGAHGYEEKRSQHLLKRKDFDDDEFEVIGIKEGKGDWRGTAKRFICSTKKGQNFGAGVTGERDTLTALWSNNDCPTWAKVKYFGVSNDGIPRFPVVIDYGFEEGRTD